MLTAGRWAYLCHPAYVRDYLLPAVIAHTRVLPTPPIVASRRVAEAAPGPPVEVAGLARLRCCSHAVVFDTRSALLGAALRLPVVLVCHSLVGKGLYFNPRRTPLAVRLAAGVAVPHRAYVPSLPSRLSARTEAIGHLPFDWLHLPPASMSAAARAALDRWEQVRRPRVLLLATAGRFSCAEILGEAATSLGRWGVGYKIHARGRRPPGLDGLLDLHALPLPVAISMADAVVCDHSSAAIEARLLGKTVVLYEADALRRLMNGDPSLVELDYLATQRRFREPSEIAPLLDDVVARDAPCPTAVGRLGDLAPDGGAGERLMSFLSSTAETLASARAWPTWRRTETRT